MSNTSATLTLELVVTLSGDYQVLSSGKTQRGAVEEYMEDISVESATINGQDILSADDTNGVRETIRLAIGEDACSEALFAEVR